MSSTARSAVALLVLVAACDRGRDATPAEAKRAANEGVASKGQPPLAHKPFYRVDAKPSPACAVGRPCEAELVLTALGAYHVNADYPTKFVADPASELAVEGHGTFKVDGDKTGTLKLRFTPTKAGAAKLVGAFKLSVCTDENCEIDAPNIALDITSS